MSPMQSFAQKTGPVIVSTCRQQRSQQISRRQSGISLTTAARRHRADSDMARELKASRLRHQCVFADSYRRAFDIFVRVFLAR